MATQIVNIGINVSDNGTAKKTVKNFQEIEAAATRAQRAAQGINAPVKSTLAPGGTSGSRQASAPTGSQQMMSGQQYGNLRGSAGVTGASARDFANQAQGLGGLVRLYATYAANIFAVSAAFSALSNAMDTANLVKGLDQLGAASGTALGTLSKRLVETTDGAISLREAMESVAKASSSGMSSENILRMGKVAKQAAQALGVDMSDAVNRLTRGITKLEPELLDELGIFTKVDMATQAYAKSVGKSASAITDFEKRMAFANAVLEEGERKFNAIDFETNPYTKLLASLKNVAQEGLSLVNTVLAPIVRFMSESPRALALAIGALGLALVKQALPALGQFKAGLREAAEESAAIAKLRAKDATAAQQTVDAIAEERANATQRRIKDSTDMLAKVKQSNIQSVRDLVSADLTNLTKENLKTINTAISGVEAQANAVRRTADTARKEGEGPSRLEALKAEETALRDFANVNKAALSEEARLAKDADKQNKILSLNQQVAAKAKINSVKDSIVANAAYNGSLIGVTGAIKLMNAELDQSGIRLGVFSKAMLFARAGVAAFAGVVTTVMSSIGGFLNIIATVSAAVAFAASFFSTNSKQVQAFDSAITAADDSLLNLGRTLDDIGRKPFGEQFNTKSLLATATAITEIATSVSGLISKTLAADKAASGFDRFIDGVKTLWGGDLRSQFGKSISAAVFDSFESLSDSQEAKKAKASIASILDVSPEASKKDFEAAFKAIADNEPKLRQVERAMKDLGMSFGQAADDAQQFDIATTQSKDALKGFIDQFKVKDPLSQFATSIIDQSSKTAKALELPEKAIGRLASIVQDTTQLQLFGFEDQKSLMQYGDQIVNINKNFEAQKSAVKDSAQEVKKLEKALEDLRTVDAYGQESSDAEMAGNRAFEQAKKQLDARRDQLSREQNLLQSTQTEVTAITARFPQLAANQLAKGADILYTSIAAGFAKGSNSFADAVLGAVGDLPGLAKQRTDMELRKLQSEGQLLKIQASMLQATLANTAQLQKRSAEEAVSTAQSDVRQVGDEASIARLKKAQQELDEINKKISIIQIDPKQALGAIGQVKKEILSGNALIQKDATELFGYLTSLAGNALQQANNATDQEAVRFKGVLALQAEKAKQELKALDARKTANNLETQALDIIKQQDGFLSEQRIGELQSLQITAARIAGSEKELSIQQKLDALETAKTRGGKFAPTDEVYSAERALLLAAKKNAQTETENKIKQIGVSTTKQISDEQQRQIALQDKLNGIYKQGSDALQATEDKIRDIQNETAKSLGTFTPEYQAEQDAQLKSTQIRLQAERDAQALTTQFIITSYRLQAEAKQKLDANASPAAIQEVEKELAAEAAAYGSKVIAINKARDAELDALKKTEDARKEASGFDTMLNSLKALDSSWANFGTTLADSVSAFVDLTKSQKQYASTIDDLEKKRDAEQKGSEKYLELQGKIDKTQQDSAKDEATRLAKSASITKKMFNEKTFAYKALDKIERAMHLYKMAVFVKETAMDIWATGVSVANSATRTGASIVEAGVDGVKAVVKAISSLPFPLNIAAGAATAAVVAGLLSQIGGKGPSVGGGSGFVPTAEQRQETQGTAMGYDSSGNKVQVRRGVFGDTDAKSESIANSLEVIKNNSVDGLAYDNKMLRALENLNQALNSAAKGLFGIKGLRAGSLSGVTEGTNTSGGFLGIGGLFSKSTSKSIVDSGLQLKGTFYDLANGVRGTINTFETVSTTVKKSGFLGIGGSTSTSVATQFKDLAGIDRKAFEALVNTFNYAADLLYSTAETAGVASAAVDAGLKSISVDQMASLRGLTGEDFTKELSAVIGSVLDDASLVIFSSFEKYANFGEGMLETVVRVVDTNTKIDQALKNMGVSFDVSKDYTQTISGVTKFFGITVRNWTQTIGETSKDITEALAKAAGGLDKFLEQAQYFRENFLTEAEQLAPIQSAVTQEMSRLGFASVDTRDEFKTLVQSLDLGSIAGRKTYQALMNVQEGFNRVAEAAEAAKEKIEQEAESLNQQLLQVLGNTNALRQLELDKLDSSNRALQMYIWYLEDAKVAISEYSNKLKEAQNNITAAISAITSAEGKIKAVRDQATSEYISATQKVADAQQAIANIASQAAQRMYDLGKSMRSFIKDTLLGGSSVSSISSFESTVSGALAGNAMDIENVQAMAEKAIQAARQSSKSSFDFASKQADILASVGKVADFAESQGLAKPEEDPLITANKTLEESLALQSEALAVAKSIDASLTSTVRNLFTEYTDATAELQKSIEDKSAAEAAAAETKLLLEAISENTGLSVDALKTSDTNNVDYLKFLTDIQIERLGLSTDQIPDAIASAADSTNQTLAKNISDLSTNTMYSIAVNTSEALPLLSASLTNQGSMISLLNAVVSNTHAIAEGVKAGSGTASSGSGNIFSSIGSAIGGVLGGVVSSVKKVWKKIFSDSRMKENVSLYKTLDNGINIYDFDYKAPYSSILGTDRKRGVLAQEVESRYPSAVSTTITGMKQVDYSKLPVPNNILKFAKGGVFSNQVVTRPTSFQLAQMGEAGPEAVVPLRRDSKGNLGIVAPNSNNNKELLLEMRALRQEVEKLRYEAQATARHTNKATKILERVTRDGESLLVTDSATI